MLRALVLDEGRELLSADVRACHRLGGPSTVQAALGALVRDDVSIAAPSSTLSYGSGSPVEGV
ncbi:MAG: hypothetical protein DMF94_13010 [Acidobacteria bacterium]|nr:MAG: hypothetical protein DMF94_13010 [Acidobacteriota bacterium]